MEDSVCELSVELSHRGKRVVKAHYMEHVRNPYGLGPHKRMPKAHYSANHKPHQKKHLFFKIMIPYGRNYNQAWLLTSIVNECGHQFRVFQFHYVNKMAVFYVDSFSTARLLLQISKKINADHHHKVIILASPLYLTPEAISGMAFVDTAELGPLNTMHCTDHSKSHIQTCLQKRYNESLQSLDLTNLHNDRALLAAQVDICLDNSSLTDIILQIISQDFQQLLTLNLSHNQLSKLTGLAYLSYITPFLRSLNLSYNKLRRPQDLDFIHNLELKELWLEGNPLHESAENPSVYYRMITYHFPKIELLDGLAFKQNSFFELEASKPLPPAKGSFFLRDDIYIFLTGFLQQYFSLYDSTNRQTLLPLYHEHACCSFSSPNVFYPKFWFEHIKEYLKENRNFLRVKKQGMRQQMLKYNRLQVVGFLCNLPATEHDLQSLTVDVTFHITSLICFCVEGRFKEVKKNLFIPFRRTFIIVPASDNGAQIINDQMVIPNSYDRPSAQQCSGSPPATSYDQTIISFSKLTGMKHNWAFKCLEDNNWDVKEAMRQFTILKDQNAVPLEAFKDFSQ